MTLVELVILPSVDGLEGGVAGGLLGAGVSDAVSGWPGEDAFPPQPMVSQTRAVLRRYDPDGHKVSERVFADCGHTPYIEKPEEFDGALHAQLRSAAPVQV